MNSFMLEQEPEMRRLLKAMRPVRKAAGAVRDMDVLVADALTLPNAANNESMVRLVEHLGSLRDKSSGKPWLDSLGKVKDQIGDWHDWCELKQIAHQVLDKKDDGATLKQIAETVNDRFEQAVATANKMRTRYLSGGAAGKRGQINDSVVKTAARLAG